MSQWLPPLLFVAFGLLMHVLSGLGIRRAQRPGYGDDWDSFRREQQVRAMRSRVQDLSIGFVGASLGIAAVVAFTAGSPFWWLSALASVLFVALVPQTARFRQATLTALGEAPAPSAEESGRRRRTGIWLAVSGAAYLLTRVVEATTSGRITIVLGSILMLVAFGALLGAGWSSVWVSRTKRDPA